MIDKIINILLVIVFVLMTMGVISLLTSCQTHTYKSTRTRYSVNDGINEKEEIEYKRDGFISWSQKERVLDIRVLNFGI